MNTYDFNKTLKDLLEGLQDNGELAMGDACNEIYSKRILREYSNEDLRSLIEINVGLDILIPFATYF